MNDRAKPASAAASPTPPTFADVESHRDYLIRYARAQLRDAAQAEEVVQEALLAALEGLAGFSGKSALRTWLTAILRFKIIDLQRELTAERAQRLAPKDEIESAEAFFDDLFSVDGHRVTPTEAWQQPDKALEEKAFFAALERCMDRLPATTGRVFFKRDVLGHDTDTICKEENITASNCWVMLHRARLGLRECLNQTWFGGERG
ncbi:MAG: sigma-70 family RNA polymerase sigma factor [Betaproteobacteria bacterium]|nr:sigma-70 family RNA polymerase sigma factor [Betaproteobacteria bacterium]